MTVGYIDASAIVLLLQPGKPGDRIATLLSAIDAVCVIDLVEVEVPSTVGRSIDRLAWVWFLNTMVLVASESPDLRKLAVDLAWLGASTSDAFHVAAGLTTEVDVFVTASPSVAQWAELRGLSVTLIS
jgi:predicted nucleic acid-binding protein